MKKFAFVLTALMLTLSSGAHAQVGRGSRNGAQTASSNNFQAVVGIIAIAALATVAGLVAASASSGTSSHA